MKRASTGVLIALFVAFSGLNAVAAPSNASASGNTGNSAVAQSSGQTPPANFGTPPAGQIPILFNDHHVYSKPDVLKQGRVLAALVKGGTLLIPLRSMFEQMGATVSYDAGSKTATVSKPGAQVQRGRISIGLDAQGIQVRLSGLDGSVEAAGHPQVYWRKMRRVVIANCSHAASAT